MNSNACNKFMDVFHSSKEIWNASVDIFLHWEELANITYLFNRFIYFNRLKKIVTNFKVGIKHQLNISNPFLTEFVQTNWLNKLFKLFIDSKNAFFTEFFSS